MLAEEARAARLALGLSETDLAAETNLTPNVVAAWESGRIKVPRDVATDLTWRLAHLERITALAASGLPDCSWVAAFAGQPVPEGFKPQAAHFARLTDHTASCDVCKAREAFIAERFPAMPAAPRRGWVAIALPIVDAVRRLPSWAQPAATGAMLFGAYTLLRLIFVFPGLPTAVVALLASASIGAVVGLGYGQYQRWRKQKAMV